MFVVVPEKTINWLLESDPSIKWQVMQDLKNDDFTKVFKVRRSMTKTGWAADLLALQDKETYMWGGGLYSPKWTSTTYTMLFLKRLGLLPNRQTVNASKLLLDKGLKKDGGINYIQRKNTGETCITGMILGIVSFNAVQDNRIEGIIDYLLNEQMKDGGWNCRSGSKHSSFNTTLSVLEGLLAFRETYNDNKRLTEIRDMQNLAHEFLLQHKLYQSHRTGEVASKEFIKLAFPPRWRYNILSALDYFQNIDIGFDERFIDAIDLMNNKSINGRWKAQKAFYSGKNFIELEPSRVASRWVTFKALRINKWWDKKSRGKI